MKGIWPIEIAQFLEQNWSSPSHRRMFIAGQVAAKVGAMFQLSPGTETPDEACTCAALWLKGLESGDEAEYAECDKQAMRVYEVWRRSRELH